MKKLIIIFMIIVSILLFCSCEQQPEYEIISQGLVTRTVTRDTQGRIVQEIIYNSDSGMTIITTYTYFMDNGAVLVEDSTVTIFDREGNIIQ